MDDMQTTGDAIPGARPARRSQPAVQPGVIEDAIAAAVACERACSAHAAEAHGDEQDVLAIIQDTADICRAVVPALSRWTPDGGRHIDLLVAACTVACAACAEADDGGHAEVTEACATCRSALLAFAAASHAQEP